VLDQVSTPYKAIKHVDNIMCHFKTEWRLGTFYELLICDTLLVCEHCSIWHLSKRLFSGV